MKPKISVITPSARKEGLGMVQKALRRQDFSEYEWIVASPFEYDGADVWLKDPPKKEGDYYALCKAWNQAFANASGELIISYQDLIWIEPDALSRFWEHYKKNPKGLIAAIGHHYMAVDNIGRPHIQSWTDPRARTDLGSFYEVPPSEMEMSLCSVPKQAILDCGGIDEEYDKCPAVGEKEMCFRIDKLGYKFYIDQTIEYRALHHERLTKDWDQKYLEISTPLFTRHMMELAHGKRELNVKNIEKYIE